MRDIRFFGYIDIRDRQGGNSDTNSVFFLPCVKYIVICFIFTLCKGCIS